jgi:hypothetical protein
MLLTTSASYERKEQQQLMEHLHLLWLHPLAYMHTNIPTPMQADMHQCTSPS